MEPADSTTSNLPSNASAPDDKELVQAIVDGDTEAIAELFDRYSGMLTALSLRILHDPADAEEILQETFLQVWNQASRYDPERSSVSTWLVLKTMAV